MRFLSHITALVLFVASGMYTHAQDVQNNDTPSISQDEFERLQSENKNYVKLLEDQLQVNKEQEQQHNEALKQTQQDAELRIKEAENTAQAKVDEAKSAADSAVKQAQQEADRIIQNGGTISQENYRNLQREIINTDYHYK